MNQQYNATVKHYSVYQMFKLSASCPNSCPQLKSLLINRLINDHLLNA